MQILKNIDNIANFFPQGCVATIGNFDGVHLGHQKLLKQVTEKSQALGLPSVVISFDPHPLEVMRGNAAPASIINLDYKMECIKRLGVDFVVLLSFTKELAKQTPEDFVGEVLVKALRIKHLFVGYDYAFGKKRSGNAELLQQLGNSFGFTVTQLAPVFCNGEIVSSTRIREFLSTGKLAAANQMLNRPHTLEGTVIHGQGRGGKLLGFATANIEKDADILLPPCGIYTVKVCLADACTQKDQLLLGVANVGTNPTFGDEGLHLEVHILDFNKDIYGKRIRVKFYSHLRSEKTFSNIQALVEQIKADIESTKKFFASYTEQDNICQGQI